MRLSEHALEWNCTCLFPSEERFWHVWTRHPLTTHICAVQSVHRRGTHTTRLAQVTRIAVSSLCAWKESVIWSAHLTLCCSLACRSLEHIIFLIHSSTTTQEHALQIWTTRSTPRIPSTSWTSPSSPSRQAAPSRITVAWKPAEWRKPAHDNSHRLWGQGARDCLKDRRLSWRSNSFFWRTERNWRRSSPSSDHRRSERNSEKLGHTAHRILKIPETSYTQMHSDDSVQSIADSDLEDGELQKCCLHHCMSSKLRWNPVQSCRGEREKISAQYTRAARKESLTSHPSEGQKASGNPTHGFHLNRDLIKISVFGNADPSNLRGSLLGFAQTSTIRHGEARTSCWVPQQVHQRTTTTRRIEEQRLALQDAQCGFVESRREQVRLHKEKSVKDKVLRNTQIRNMHEVPETRRMKTSHKWRQHQGRIPMPTFATKPLAVSSTTLVDIPQNCMVGQQRQQIWEYSTKSSLPILIFHRMLCCGSKKWRWLILWTSLKSSRSVYGKHLPNFEMLDARIASALNKTIQNSRRKSIQKNRKPRKRISSHEEDRSPSWSTTTFDLLVLMIQHSIMLIYSVLLFMMTIFRNSI